MPSQRPFLSNFLAAFRAHQQTIPKAAASSLSSSSAVAASAQTIWTSAQPSKPVPASTTTADPAIVSPRPVNPKAPQAYGAAAASAAPATTSASERQLQHSFSPLQHNVSPATHLPRSPPSPGVPVYGPPNKPQPSYPTAADSQPWSQARRRHRRGSDSSSDSGGFREARGGAGEKWFVGGRTASGEERYYKLSMIKRDRSSDRVSADRLSL